MMQLDLFAPIAADQSSWHIDETIGTWGMEYRIQRKVDRLWWHGVYWVPDRRRAIVLCGDDVFARELERLNNGRE